jgi:hypothetical protein
MFVSDIMMMECRNDPIRDGASKGVLDAGASMNEGCSKHRQLPMQLGS